MQYVNGLDVARGIQNEVNYINTSTSYDWKLVTNENDSMTYCCECPNNILLFKHVGDIDAPAEDIWNVLYETKNQELFDDFCVKSKTIEELDSLNFVDFIALASPLGGTTRYFCLLKTCSMDIQSRKYSILYRSIQHQGAEQYIQNLDGVQFFMDCKAGGWLVEEISPNKSRITVISQIWEENILPFVPHDRLQHFLNLYKQTAFHTILKIPNLRKYVYQINNQSHQSQYSKGSFELFKRVSDTIASTNESGTSWNLFRTNRDMEFYYKEYFGDYDITSYSNKLNNNQNNSNSNNNNNNLNFNSSTFNSSTPSSSFSTPCASPSNLPNTINNLPPNFNLNDDGDSQPQQANLDTEISQPKEVNQGHIVHILTSGFFNVDSTREVIESFLLSYNTPLVDNWTYYCEGVQEIDNKTTIKRVKFRLLLEPGKEINHYIVRQVVQLPLSIGFVGYQSIEYPDQNKNIWFDPCGYFIMPLEKGYTIRYLLQFKMTLPNFQINVKKLILCVSERLMFSFISVKHHIQMYKKAPINLPIKYHPHYDSFRGKSLNDILDIFSKIAIDNESNDNDGKGESKQGKNKETNQNNINDSIEEFFVKMSKSIDSKNIEEEKKKRKYIEMETNQEESNSKVTTPPKTPTLMTITPQFCFNRNYPNTQTIPFTSNWDQHIRRKPFLLLLSTKQTSLNNQNNHYLNIQQQQKSTTNNFKTNSLFDILPDEIIQLIFSYLDASHLTKMSMTCKLFHSTGKDDYLWKHLYESKFIGSKTYMFIDDLLNNQINSGQNNNNNNNQHSNQNNNNEYKIEKLNQHQDSSWRKMYVSYERVELNWRKGNARTSIIRGHKGRINCLQYGQEIAVTGSRDKEFRFWKMGTKHCTNSMKQSNTSVVSFEKDCFHKPSSEFFPYCLSNPGVLRVGYSNGQINYLNLESYQINSQSRYLYLADGYIFNQDQVYIWENNTVQMFNESTGQKLLHLSSNDRSKINQCKLSLFSPILFTANTDRTIKIYDIKQISNPDPNQIAAQPQITTTIQQTSPTMTLQGHTASVNCIEFYGDNYLLSGSNDRTIRVWDMRKTDQSLQVIRNHKSHIHVIKCVSNQRLVSGDDETISTFNLDNTMDAKDFIVLDTTNSKSCSVTALEVDDESIMAGFNDGVVKYYDFTHQPYYHL